MEGAKFGSATSSNDQSCEVLKAIHDDGSFSAVPDSIPQTSSVPVTSADGLSDGIRGLSVEENIEGDGQNENRHVPLEISPRDLLQSQSVAGIDADIQPSQKFESFENDGERRCDGNNFLHLIKANKKDHDIERVFEAESNKPDEPSIDFGHKSKGIGEKEDARHDRNAKVRKMGNEGSISVHPFPLRPDAEDCAFYLRTGTCKFGLGCRFNHPIGGKNHISKEKAKERDESSQLDCKYYSRAGGCKYGKACKYNHPKAKFSSVTPVLDFNFLGLPLRSGVKECMYYMKNGSCKYGTSCRFHHPDPTAREQDDSPANMSTHAVPMPFSPVVFPQLVPSSTSSDWSSFQGSRSFVTAPPQQQQQSMYPTHCTTATTGAGTVEGSAYPNRQGMVMADDFPERPGQPECSYFLKTGVCRYGPACRYHHPKFKVPQPSACHLSEKGLPFRPDRITCTYYERYGICKYGPACQFNHPST